MDVRGAWIIVVALLAGTTACSGEDAPAGGDASVDGSADVGGTDGSADAGAQDSGGADSAIADASATDADGGAGDAAIIDASGDGGPPRVVTCADAPPPGAQMPAALPTYPGTCPALVPGMNTLRSGGADRNFLLVVPAALDPAERLPLIFMWHWLGGSANSFLRDGEVQQGADNARFFAAVPESKGDLMFRWPYLQPPVHSNARLDEEARFFDDMLACIAEQYNVNDQCVASAGVSAGALFTGQLAQVRSERLSSILSLSGGVGVAGDFLNPVRPWRGAVHAMPALVLWGGPTDFCGVDFNSGSIRLERGLMSDGHYLVECIHNCAHAQPPLTPAPGESAFEALWHFVLDHPYWLRDGESPYQTTGLPANLPPWCGEGRGGATIRTGMCAGGPLGSCI